jgi:hypothetical protein
MSRIYITPRPGFVMRDPLNPAVQFAADGEWRTDSPAYRRLARVGDVVISDGPPAPAPVKPARNAS